MTINTDWPDFIAELGKRERVFSLSHSEILNPYTELKEQAQVGKLFAAKNPPDKITVQDMNSVVEVLKKLPAVFKEIDKQLDEKPSRNNDRAAREAMAVHILALEVKSSAIYTTPRSNAGYASHILDRADEQLQSALERKQQSEEELLVR